MEKTKSSDPRVRVLRVLEYTGPQEWVNRTLAGGLLPGGTGSRVFGTAGACIASVLIDDAMCPPSLKEALLNPPRPLLEALDAARVRAYEQRIADLEAQVHRLEDPHCTCNDCIAHHAAAMQQEQEGDRSANG